MIQKCKTSKEIGGMGHSIKRKEDDRFIQGKGNYVDDIKLDGMLHMDIVRSPYAYAKIKSIDSSKALEIPGVVAVVTGKELEQYILHWMPTLMSDTQMVLPTDTVMYQSQEVAAVIATDRFIARDGKEAVKVEYEPMKPLMNPHKSMDADAPVLRPDKEGKKDFIEHDWTDKNVLLFGSEGYGLKFQTKKNCDFLLKIDINKNIESLNISNSTAIVFHFIDYLKKKK